MRRNVSPRDLFRSYVAYFSESYFFSCDFLLVMLNFERN